MAGEDFTFSTHDNPSAERFDLQLASLSKRTICLAPDQWPNQAGKVEWAKDYVSVLAGQKRFPLAEWNGGYCIGGCYAARVRHGESVEAFIPYSDFESFGADSYAAEKRLIFSPRADWCPR